MNNSDILKELEVVLSEIKENTSKCNKGVLKETDAKAFLKNINLRLDQLLDPATDAYKIYDRMRRERSLWWTEHFTDYVHKSDCSHFAYYKNILNEVIKEFEPVFKDKAKKEYYFSPGQVYEATKSLIKILKTATNNLIIIDTYLDSDIFDYLDEIDNNIVVQMLTTKNKPIFSKLLTALKLKKTNIEARTCTMVHDRFLIIDNNAYWHLGTSINSIGKKAFMINKVEDSTEINNLIKDFNNWWNNGAEI